MLNYFQSTILMDNGQVYGDQLHHQSDIDRLKHQCDIAMKEIENLRKGHADKTRDLEYHRQQNHSKFYV